MEYRLGKSKRILEAGQTAKLECPNCKSLIKINSDINLVPQNIYCDCGDYSFSCIKNSNKE